MTVESILTEWSYRLPKGYPTRPKDYEMLYHVILEMTNLTPLEARVVVNKAQGIITEQVEFTTDKILSISETIEESAVDYLKIVEGTPEEEPEDDS